MHCDTTILLISLCITHRNLETKLDNIYLIENEERQKKNITIADIKSPVDGHW